MISLAFFVESFCIQAAKQLELSVVTQPIHSIHSVRLISSLTQPFVGRQHFGKDQSIYQSLARFRTSHLLSRGIIEPQHTNSGSREAINPHHNSNQARSHHPRQQWQPAESFQRRSLSSKRMTVSVPAPQQTKSPISHPQSQRTSTRWPHGPPATNKSTHRSRSVIMKLLAFTLAMVVVPIGSYFVTVDHLFKGKPHPLLPPFLPLSPTTRT